MSRFLNALAIGTLCVSFGVAPVSVAFSADKEKKEHAAPAVSGEITKVDAAAKTITVKAKDGEKTFTANDSTKITVDGVAGTIEGLKEGAHVKVVADAGGVASAITVGAAAGGEKKKKEK